MKKQYFLFIILVSFTVSLNLFNIDSFAQGNYKNPGLEINRANVWQFGDESTPFAGDAPSLHFESGHPIVMNGGKPYGFSSLCDSAGSLVLYGGYYRLYNKNHTIFQNGSGTIGFDPGVGIQHSLAVPKPGDPDLVYYFTVPFRLWYNLVDLSINTIIEKNVELIGATPGVGAKIAAVHHCNGHDIWVMVHELYNRRFRAYLVTDSGITTPVITDIAPTDNGFGFAEQGGMMKFSPNGERLAITFSGIDIVPYVYDFDKSTGILTNPIPLQKDTGDFGISFSPDNSKLYIGTLNGKVLQYDLEAGDAVAIAASKKVIYENPAISFAIMQIGRDGKIYVAQLSDPGRKYVGVINNPNALGTLCSFNWQGIYLNGANNYRGLTNTVESYFYTGSSAYPCYGEPISGIAQSPSATNARVYPNPFSDFTTIEVFVPNHSLNEKTEYILFDALGRECKTDITVMKIGSTEIKFMLRKGQLNPGIYFLTIKTQGQNLSLKLSII
ncbi:MAG: hypothetical protein KatS3mg031_1249 [Chitinophagales bacterium]|nr:MAG: hypothetical protein KatS3mg031_1249 [Chitinophagales bacterium]